MKYNNCFLILLIFFYGCTIPETLFITNNSDDVCTVTIKLSSKNKDLRKIKEGLPYLSLSEKPLLKIEKETNIAEFNKKLDYWVHNNDSIEIYFPSKSSICFASSLVIPSGIDSISFKTNKKKLLFNRKTFRKSLEKHGRYSRAHLYIFRN